MVTINVYLEGIHVDQFQNRRHNKHKAQQDLQNRFTERI
jgi:hypothetical protein